MNKAKVGVILQNVHTLILKEYGLTSVIDIKNRA